MIKYEIAVVFNPNFDEEALKAEFDKIVNYITRFGGEIEKVDNWGKRKLAYEINKITEGYYYFIAVSGPNTLPKEVEARLRINEGLLRYLVTKRPDQE